MLKSCAPRLNLANRLRLALCGLAAFVALVLGAAFMWRQAVHNAHQEAFLSDLQAVQTLERMAAALRRTKRMTDSFLASGDDSWLGEREEAVALYQAAYAQAVELSDTAAERTQLADLDGQREELFRFQEARISDRLQQQRPRRSAVELERDVLPLLRAAGALRELNLTQLEGTAGRLRRVSRLTWAAAAALIFLGIGGLALLLRRQLTLPLEDLRRRVAGFSVDKGGAAAAVSAVPEFRLLARQFERTERRLRRRYRELAAHNEMSDRMVAMVSHEYGNAMTAILAGLYFIDGSVEASQQQREKVARSIRGNAKSLVQMASDFLSLAQRHKSDGVLRRDPTRLDRLVEQVIDDLDYHRAARGITLDVDLAAGAKAVVHSDTLIFVLHNLLRNAYKYTAKGGRVTVRLSAEPGGVRFTVEDTGIGMDAETVQQVLSGGYRSPEAKKAASGFGVGLSLVRQILEEHGARLDITSVKDRGTTFSFLLADAA